MNFRFFRIACAVSLFAGCGGEPDSHDAISTAIESVAAEREGHSSDPLGESSVSERIKQEIEYFQDEDYLRGATLQEERKNEAEIERILRYASERPHVIQQILSEDYIDFPTNDAQQRIRELHRNAVFLALKSPASLPTYVKGYVNRESPVIGDLVLFEVFNDAFVEARRKGSVSDFEMSEWRALAEGNNPIYRLLGARQFRKVTDDRGDLIEYYKSYVGEKENLLRTEIVDLVFQAQSVQSAGLLREMQASWNPVDDDLVKHIEAAIEWLESNIGQ